MTGMPRAEISSSDDFAGQSCTQGEKRLASARDLLMAQSRGCIEIADTLSGGTLRTRASYSGGSRIDGFNFVHSLEVHADCARAGVASLY
jgi:hypothetical protein